jgi:hypothetical protein
MAAWMTPRSSCSVDAIGTSTRRQIIGLISNSRIFTCRIEPAGAVNAGRALRVMSGLGCRLSCRLPGLSTSGYRAAPRIVVLPGSSAKPDRARGPTASSGGR